MGRPPLTVGTYGSIAVREMTPGRYRARTRFRDWDGQVRDVVRHGPSRTAAERSLKAALVDRQHTSGDEEIRPDMRVRDLAERWLRDVAESGRAPTTKARYATLTRAHVVPGIGGFVIREVSTSRIDRFLRVVRERHGASTARSVRAVCSQMFKLAARHDAITANPVAGVSEIPSNTRPARALTRDESRALLDALRRDELASAHDLPDLTAFMLATGVRIGEALALQVAQLDMDAGTVEVNATVTDFGREPRTKTDAGWRVLALPASTVAMLRRRLADPEVLTEAAVFPSPRGMLRDTSNTAAHMRRAFNRAGFPWLTSHGLRKTAATRLDEAGLSARQIADQLGHARPSMTTDVYLGRRVTVTDAATVLEP